VRNHHRTDDGMTLGNVLVGIAIALIGVGAFLGAGFLNYLETTR